MFASPIKCASPTINPWRRHCYNIGADMGQKATVLCTVYECGQTVMVEHPVFYLCEVIAVCKCGSRVFVVLLFLTISTSTRPRSGRRLRGR